MARMSLKTEANKLYLSYLWWIVEPSMYIGVFYLVFHYILDSRQEDFIFFLVCGKLPFLWFSKSVLSAADSLLKNRGLIASLDIPNAVFPYVAVLETLYKQWVSLLLLLGAALYFGSYPTLQWLWLLPLVAIMFVVILGVSMIAALLVTMIQDLQIVVSMGILFLMFSSGVFWDVNSIADDRTRELVLLLNPLAFMLDAFRQTLMYGRSFDIDQALFILAAFATCIVIAHLIFVRASNHLSKHVLQT